MKGANLLKKMLDKIRASLQTLTETVLHLYPPFPGQFREEMGIIDATIRILLSGSPRVFFFLTRRNMAGGSAPPHHSRAMGVAVAHAPHHTGTPAPNCWCMIPPAHASLMVWLKVRLKVRSTLAVCLLLGRVPWYLEEKYPQDFPPQAPTANDAAHAASTPGV